VAHLTHISSEVPLRALLALIFTFSSIQYQPTMSTATASPSITSPLSTVKVNVRLCGSIPRQELEALSLTKCAPLVLRSSHELSTSSYLAKNGSREARDVPHSTHHTIEDDIALQLCSQLCDMHQRQQQQVNASQRRVTPTFEAPTWAVPAQGEARLEVCSWSIRLHASAGS
jgi:hypothetical protein